MTEMMQLPFREYTHMKLWKLQYWLLLAVTMVAIPFATVLWFVLVTVGALPAVFDYYRSQWRELLDSPAQLDDADILLNERDHYDAY